MTYANQPVAKLLRGPLLRTPQGWLVLAGLAGYWLLALLFGIGALIPPLGKDLGSAVVVCLAWPLITFLYFVKNGLPDFEASWGRAAMVGACVLAPVAYVLLQ